MSRKSRRTDKSRRNSILDSKVDSRNSSIRSIERNIIDKSDPRDPVYHLAQCLFYSIHLHNITKVSTDRLNANGPQLLMVLMYDAEREISNNPIKYLNDCFKLFKDITGEYFNFAEYIEMLMNKFMLKKLIPKLSGDNYARLFSSVFNKTCVSYINDLFARTPSLYIYDDPQLYKGFCVEFLKSRLITAFEVTVHIMIDNQSESVPRPLYETVREERDKLAKKYKKLKKKYNRLKRELE